MTRWLNAHDEVTYWLIVLAILLVDVFAWVWVGLWAGRKAGL